MRLQVVVLFFAGMIAVCPSAFGQEVDLARDRIPVTNLAGPWRFHTGDDPAWASPAFDDSRWGLLRADIGWSEQGYKGYSGVAWYRLEIDVPAGSGPAHAPSTGAAAPAARPATSWNHVRLNALATTGLLCPRPLDVRTWPATRRRRGGETVHERHHRPASPPRLRSAADQSLTPDVPGTASLGPTRRPRRRSADLNQVR